MYVDEPLGRTCTPDVEVHANRYDALGAKTEIDVHDVQKASNQQARADEENARERDLRDDERLAESTFRALRRSRRDRQL